MKTLHKMLFRTTVLALIFMVVFLRVTSSEYYHKPSMTTNKKFRPTTETTEPENRTKRTNSTDTSEKGLITTNSTRPRTTTEAETSDSMSNTTESSESISLTTARKSTTTITTKPSQRHFTNNDDIETDESPTKKQSKPTVTASELYSPPIDSDLTKDDIFGEAQVFKDVSSLEDLYGADLFTDQAKEHIIKGNCYADDICWADCVIAFSELPEFPVNSSSHCTKQGCTCVFNYVPHCLYDQCLQRCSLIRFLPAIVVECLGQMCMCYDAFEAEVKVRRVFGKIKEE